MSLLYGENEALERVRGQMKQRNTGGIMYPSGTNGRGNPGGREAHARGDSVGGLPSEGGSRMKPMHGGNHAMEGVVEKNKRNAVRQTRNEMGRSAHASGGQPRCEDNEYSLGDRVKKMANRAGRNISKAGRSMAKGAANAGSAIAKGGLSVAGAGLGAGSGFNHGGDVDGYAFGAGIKKDFKDLGHGIKKGFNKKISNPIKNEVVNPAKKGLSQAVQGARKTANVAEHEVRRGAASAKRGAQAAGRAVRNEYRQHGRD